jgi:class 3 adenylate cyclase
MALKDDLDTDVKRIFRDAWTTREGTVVPESSDLKLGNEAVKLDAAVLYSDLAASTRLVEKSSVTFAAEVYKTYLHCAARIIISQNGVITAYDGDRIMGVFIGKSKCTDAARAALKINCARLEIINPALKAQYPTKDYELHHTTGVDTSELFVARTGIRGSNDLVWVGRAANYAAKLTELTADYPTWITGAVYDNLHATLKTTNGHAMWEERTWTTMNSLRIFRSSWKWPV